MIKSFTDSSMRKHKSRKAVGSEGCSEDTESSVCGVCGDAVQDDPPPPQGRNPYFVKVTVKFGSTGSVPGSPQLCLLPFHLHILLLVWHVRITNCWA